MKPRVARAALPARLLRALRHPLALHGLTTVATGALGFARNRVARDLAAVFDHELVVTELAFNGERNDVAFDRAVFDINRRGAAITTGRAHFAGELSILLGQGCRGFTRR